MILTSLYQYYRAHRDLLEFGFSKEPVHFLADLSKDGHIKRLKALGTSDKFHKGQPMAVPRPSKRTSGVESNFMRDKSAYALGVPKTGRSGKENDAFKELHLKVLAGCNDKHLRPFLEFLENWKPSDFEDVCKKSNIVPKDVHDAYIAFSFEGRRLHDLPSVKQSWLDHLKQYGGDTAMCAVTGKSARIERLHPSIKGISGQITGSIVSFNENAYESYGKKQGYNSPVSEEVAHGYVTALNHLLKENKTYIAGQSIVWWSKDDSSEDVLDELLSQEPVESRITDADVGDFLEKVKDGKRTSNLNAGLKRQLDSRCYVLGMLPNKSRISVDFWYVNTLGEICEAYRQHYEDLQLEPKPRIEPDLTFENILKQTAVRKKSKNVQKMLPSQLLDSVLREARYPNSLLIAMIHRMRIKEKDHLDSDDYVKAATIKACLMRNARHNRYIEAASIPVEMDESETHPGYVLGRMFAVLEKIQKDAINAKATIRDKFYATASSKPALVFPLLIRNSKHHLSALFKDEKTKGYAIRHEKIMQEIMSKVNSEFPNVLDLTDQGRFAIGYYHQQSEYCKKKEPAT